jgi:methyl-accepting chemotaxis protein
VFGSKSQANPVESVDGIQETVLKLSSDIGAMADRIGEMADRIGQMADRILETQRIQSENLKAFQDNSLEMARILNEQLKANQALMTKVIDKIAD